jgi:hypothetical protein
MSSKAAFVKELDSLVKMAEHTASFARRAEEGEKEEESTDKSKRKGPPPKWEEFMKAKYEGGKKQVPNPNSKTRVNWPRVTVETAMREPNFMKRVMEEYKKWITDNKDEKGPEKAPEKAEDSRVLNSLKSVSLEGVSQAVKVKVDSLIKELTESPATAKKQLDDLYEGLRFAVNDKLNAYNLKGGAVKWDDYSQARSYLKVVNELRESLSKPG